MTQTELDKHRQRSSHKHRDVVQRQTQTNI